VRTAKFDADQLESLTMAAFELLGKPEVEAQELARAILRATEQRQSGYQELPENEPKRRLG
jgi:LDH2 family malate/lactate/ureidoglycolate dehydrogenase